jgi:hypothetical protein
MPHFDAAQCDAWDKPRDSGPVAHPLAVAPVAHPLAVGVLRTKDFFSRWPRPFMMDRHNNQRRNHRGFDLLRTRGWNDIVRWCLCESMDPRLRGDDNGGDFCEMWEQ